MTRHQVVVVGAGAAGLTVAYGAASAGIDVALIEAGDIGGECTWRGCVPSKTLIDAAHRVHRAGNSQHLGIRASDVSVDFEQLMAHVHDVSEMVSAHEGEARLKEAGVTLYRSFARFVDPATFELEDGRYVSGKRIVIATGGRPRIPKPLDQVPHLTTDTLWSLTELPSHLVVVGGGAVGSELAQAFVRLGADVSIVTDVDRLVPNAHPGASSIVANRLEAEGVKLHFGLVVVSAATTEHGSRLALDDGTVLEASHVLVSVGKDLSLSPINAEAAQFDMEDDRPVLDSALRTTQSHIYVCGDAAGAGLTHIAGSQAAGVLVNLISPKVVAVDTGVKRWAVFTDPEIAQIGLTLDEAKVAGKRLHSTRVPISSFDRAIIEGATDGFVDVVHSRSGKLHGVTIVGPHAAELGNQWSRHVKKHHRITSLIFSEAIYPTMGATNAVVAYEWADRIARETLIGRVGRWAARMRLRFGKTHALNRAAPTPPSVEPTDDAET